MAGGRGLGWPDRDSAMGGSGSSVHIVIFENTAQNKAERDFIHMDVAPGLRALGDRVTVSTGLYEPCDVAAILWSPRNDATDCSRVARVIRNLHGRNLLIVETPIIRDLPSWWLHHRVGFDHVHGGGRFVAGDCPSDRAEALGLQPAPWRIGDGPVVIAGQLPNDFSLDGVDVTEWAIDVAGFLERTTARPVVIRPHPADTRTNWRQLVGALNVELSLGPLAADLARASAWVSLTSGSAVDAVLAGVPSICLARASSAWDVSAHSLTGLDRPWTGDRTAWLARLAYSQWTKAEIRDGQCWARLSPLVEPTAL